MTISSQVKLTSASLKGVQATLEMFASIEKDPGCKELLNRNCLKILKVTGDLEKRIAILEFEEPQYKGL